MRVDILDWATQRVTLETKSYILLRSSHHAKTHYLHQVDRDTSFWQ